MGAVSDVDGGLGSSVEGRMCTLGLDLSTTRRYTAFVSVEWGQQEATVAEPVVAPSDEDLVGAVVGAEWVGISAPFGWPGGMVSALHSYLTVGDWPSIEKSAFRYRRTDAFVRERLLEEIDRNLSPLSVASDGIALRAWRLARLREEVAERSGVRFDRSGADGVVEVFPGATLLLWGLERGVYRRAAAVEDEGESRQIREEFVSSVEAAAPWLRWVGDARSVCMESEDVADALVCAVVARAAALGLTWGVAEDSVDVANREGWVHLPKRGALEALVGAEASVLAAV